MGSVEEGYGGVEIISYVKGKLSEHKFEGLKVNFCKMSSLAFWSTS